MYTIYIWTHTVFALCVRIISLSIQDLNFIYVVVCARVSSLVDTEFLCCCSSLFLLWRSSFCLNITFLISFSCFYMVSFSSLFMMIICNLYMSDGWPFSGIIPIGYFVFYSESSFCASFCVLYAFIKN